MWREFFVTFDRLVSERYLICNSKDEQKSKNHPITFSEGARRLSSWVRFFTNCRQRDETRSELAETRCFRSFWTFTLTLGRL
jgi:hypothetical protein